MATTLRACENPFRTERLLQAHYRLEGTTWAELLARLERLEFRAALIGPHGSGKTTLLEELDRRLQRNGFGTRLIRLDAEHPEFDRGFLDALAAVLTSRDILLFDGAEQMNPLAWRLFRWQMRRAGGVIITTHHAGRLPTLWECCTSPDLLAGIAAGLLGVTSEELRCRAAELFPKHHGNLRDALREWYDLAAIEGGPLNTRNDAKTRQPRGVLYPF